MDWPEGKQPSDLLHDDDDDDHSKRDRGIVVETVDAVCVVGDALRKNQDLVNALETCPMKIEFAR